MYDLTKFNDLVNQWATKLDSKEDNNSIEEALAHEIALIFRNNDQSLNNQCVNIIYTALNIREKDFEYFKSHKDIRIQNLFKSVIQEETNIDLPNENGLHPLELAAADINAFDDYGNTPLHNAIISNDLTLVNKLIQEKSDINLPNKTGNTSLQLAISEGNFDIVLSLIKGGANIDEQYKMHNNIFYLAKDNNRLDIIEALIDTQKCDLNGFNEYGNTLLCEAILSNDLSLVNMLIQAQVDINLPNKNGKETPLQLAISKCNLDIVLSLIKSQANIDKEYEKNKKIFYLAMQTNRLDIIQALIDTQKCDLNSSDPEGNTPLHLAVIYDSLTLVKMLIEAKVNINRRNADGDTALEKVYELRKTGYKEIANFIKSHDPNSKIIRREGALLRILSHSTQQQDNLSIISTNPSIESSSINTTGSFSYLCFRKMFKSTDLLEKKHPNILPQDISNNLKEILNLASNEETYTDQQLLARIQAGKPTIISTGFSGHNVSVLIWGSHFILCNRGSQSRRALEIYTFDQEKMDISCIEKLRISCIGNTQTYVYTFFEDLPKTLNFKQTPLETSLETSFTLPMQKVGNCAWASSETAVLALLMLYPLKVQSQDKLTSTMIEESYHRFYSWLSFNQMNHLCRYLNIQLEEDLATHPAVVLKERGFKIDFEFVSKALEEIKTTLTLADSPQDLMKDFEKIKKALEEKKPL